MRTQWRRRRFHISTKHGELYLTGHDRAVPVGDLAMVPALVVALDALRHDQLRLVGAFDWGTVAEPRVAQRFALDLHGELDERIDRHVHRGRQILDDQREP